MGENRTEMKYYALKNSDGKFWCGSEKLCHPPMLVCDKDNERDAYAVRDRAKMERIAKRSERHGPYFIHEIDSANHKHLAD